MNKTLQTISSITAITITTFLRERRGKVKGEYHGNGKIMGRKSRVPLFHSQTNQIKINRGKTISYHAVL